MSEKIKFRTPDAWWWDRTAGQHVGRITPQVRETFDAALQLLCQLKLESDASECVALSIRITRKCKELAPLSLIDSDTWRSLVRKAYDEWPSLRAERDKLAQRRYHERQSAARMAR
jgi:hypothetical protein